MRYNMMITATLCMLIAAPALAGSPISNKITCPVDGEEFTVTGTASCSTMGHYISLRSITSCDFVTAIPVCPSNKLPVYKEFSENEIEVLKTIITSKEFKKASEISRFYSSYHVETHLADTNAETAFYLLLEGIWDNSELLDDQTYLEAFDSEFENIADDKDVKGKGFLYGAYAYTLIQRGDLKNAQRHVDEMSKVNDEENDYLNKYIKALNYCVDHSDEKEKCGQFATLRDHDNKP